MVKRTLYFGSPGYLNCHDGQLVYTPADNKDIPKGPGTKKVPIEDIGVLIMDNPQVTITQYLLHKLVANNTAFISCNEKHMPVGLMLNLEGNSLQQERFEAQLEASLPLKKQMWAQTVVAKILNQAALLKRQGIATENMEHWASSVTSGDSKNHESRAAVYYWQNLFIETPFFTRDREGGPPNNLLNYGYAILRAITARALVGSGLLPTLGIHHHNRYNAYCLADDIMEPYRPYVDEIVLDIIHNVDNYNELTKEIKAILLSIATVDVYINGERSLLMTALSQTSASVSKCFMGETRKINYPEF